MILDSWEPLLKYLKEIEAAQKISSKISRRMSELIEESQDSTRLYDSLLSSLPSSKDMTLHHGYEIWECGLIAYPLTSMCNK